MPHDVLKVYNKEEFWGSPLNFWILGLTKPNTFFTREHLEILTILMGIMNLQEGYRIYRISPKLLENKNLVIQQIVIECLLYVPQHFGYNSDTTKVCIFCVLHRAYTLEKKKKR